jgi:predicted metalloprotease with PDZ domain
MSVLPRQRQAGMVAVAVSLVLIGATVTAKWLGAAHSDHQEPGAPQAFAAYGLEVQTLTGDLARGLGYEGREGVVVTRVQSVGSARVAGLRAGDLIEKVNRRTIHNVDDFRDALHAVGPSRTIVVLMRNGDGARYVALKSG